MPITRSKAALSSPSAAITRRTVSAGVQHQVVAAVAGGREVDAGLRQPGPDAGPVPGVAMTIATPPLSSASSR